MPKPKMPGRFRHRDGFRVTGRSSVRDTRAARRAGKGRGLPDDVGRKPKKVASRRTKRSVRVDPEALRPKPPWGRRPGAEARRGDGGTDASAAARRHSVGRAEQGMSTRSGPASAGVPRRPLLGGALLADVKGEFFRGKGSSPVHWARPKKLRREGKPSFGSRVAAWEAEGDEGALPR